MCVRAADSTNHGRLCGLLLKMTPANPGETAWDTAREDRYAKTCFLLTRGQASETSRRAQELARLAVAHQQARNDHHTGWVSLTGGMAEQYAGNPERAIELLRVAEKEENVPLVAAAKACRAMALKKLGRQYEALRVLQDAETMLINARKPEGAGCWWDMEDCRIVLEEARRVIQ